MCSRHQRLFAVKSQSQNIDAKKIVKHSLCNAMELLWRLALSTVSKNHVHVAVSNKGALHKVY